MKSDAIPEPIREDRAFDPTEKLDRDPDEVPHPFVATVIVLSLVIAATLLVFISGHVPRHPGAILLAFVGMPALAGLAMLLARTWRRRTR